MFKQLKIHNEDNIGTGIDEARIRDLQKKLNIKLPQDFFEYLRDYNYAEIYGDPIYGINDDLPSIDILKQNEGKRHFRYGFLEIFSNDVEGTIFLRPDNGKIYNASFQIPVSDSFAEFVDLLING